MNEFEDPIDFQTTKKVDNNLVVYSVVMEIAQGVPVVGTLSINGKLVSSATYFGGPFLYNEGFIYAPVFIRRFCVSGFKLCKINVENLKTELIGKIKPLIFLDRIAEGRIYFYKDLGKMGSETVILNINK